jgi:hypothetical protein
MGRVVSLVGVLMLVLGIWPSHGQTRIARNAAPQTDTYLAVAGITEAGQPKIINDVLVLTYEQRGFARLVAAAFEHERFQELHPFRVRKRDGRSDLFVLAYPLPADITEISYRLIVDGLWITDPNAPRVRRGPGGVTVGLVDVPQPEPHRWDAPLVRDNGRVTFYLYFNVRLTPAFTAANRELVSVTTFDDPRVYITGSFNAWDPFQYRLTPNPDYPGLYEITLPLPPGRHHYYFVVDGTRVLDPYNGRQLVRRSDGFLVSTIQVP